MKNTVLKISISVVAVLLASACDNTRSNNSDNVNTKKSSDSSDIYASWKFVEAVCPDGSRIQFNGKDKIVYTFSKDGENNLNIFTQAVQDASGTINPYSNPYSPYSPYSPYNPYTPSPSDKIIDINIKFLSNVVIDTKNNIDVKIDNTPSQLFDDKGNNVTVYSNIDFSKTKSQYEFSGVYSKLDDNTLSVKGTFSSELINCSAGVNKIAPVEFQFTK